MLRRAPVLLLIAALGLLAGCGDEEELVDDGTQGVPLAGLGPQLDEAGVEVLSAETPAAATADEVVAALGKVQVTGVEATRPADVTEDDLALDADGTAGLLSVVADDSGTAVVLVFTDPSAASVLAAEDPEVFADGGSEDGRSVYLAGNVVGYAGAADDQPARVRRALDALDGPGSTGAS